MTIRAHIPLPVLLLAAVFAALVALAIVEIGPASSSTRTETQLVSAERGVVLSSVSGTGNLEPGVDDTLNFKTSGTLQHIDVHVGERVSKGQLLATLDPTSAQLAVDEARLTLQSAEDQLSQDESATSTTASSASDEQPAAGTEFVSDVTPVTRTTATTTTPTATPTPTTTSATPTTTTPATRPATTTPSPATTPAGTNAATTSGSRSSAGGGGSAGSSAGSASGSSTTSSAAAIASAQASVDSAEGNLRSAEQTLTDTKLYAPTSGTIASLASVSAGDSISAGSSGASAAASSGTSSSGAGSGSGAGGLTAGGLGSSTSSSASASSGSSSSSAFAEIIDPAQLTMTVPLSESDIAKIKVGQAATVTPEALTGVQLAAKVSSISDMGTSSSGVVSYDVTLTVEQAGAHVRPGMSASAAIVTARARGINLPNDAVPGTASLATVQVVKNGGTSSQQVVVGLRGDSRTLIVSGLSAGQQVRVTTTLPALGTSSAGTSSGSSGTLGGGAGTGGFAARALGGGFAGGGLRGGAGVRGGGG